MTTPYTFRRRTIGRAASPPTWACYEQIHDDYDDDEDDFSESASEEEDGSEDDGGGESASGDSVGHVEAAGGADVGEGVAHDMEMDVDAEGTGAADEPSSPTQGQIPAQVKGKQRAVDPPSPPSPKHRRPRSKKQKQARVYTLRPILTIQRSQGFVWNQDLFVPPYIKDRYVASTSPPNASSGPGFIPSSVSSTNSALTDYDSVEVVEIRVQEGEFDGIIP